MKYRLLAVICFASLCACTNSDTGNSASTSTPPAPTPEKAFEGKLQKFEAQFVSSINGNLKGGPYLAYKFEIDSNQINNGDLNIYDCQDSSCSVKYLIYKMSCNFPWLSCKVTDGQGQDVKKGGLYKVNASDVGELQSGGNCRQFTGGSYESCYFLTLVDPVLKQDGFYDQYFAAEFQPKAGPITDLNIYHLKHHP